MSCCDGCTVYLRNESSVPLNVSSYDATNGSIRGLSDGTGISPNGGNISFTVYSGGGTQGKATGTVTLEDSNHDPITLNFSFLPNGATGGCPCTPGGGTGQTSGYDVAISDTVGNSDGSAVLKFTVSN